MAANKWRTGLIGCAAFVLCLVFQNEAYAQTESVTVEAGAVVGTIPAIHGMNGGPLLRSDTWQPPCGNNNQHDIPSAFIDSAIPQARAHDVGPFDLDDIWIPASLFLPNAFDPTVFDPADPANYDWTHSDEFATSVYSTGVTQLYPRIGYSAHACNPPVFDFGTPPANGSGPDRFDVYGQIVLRVLMHYTQGWDNGFFYDVDEIEIWNEPHLANFWNGTVQDYHDLYMSAWNAVHNNGHPEFDQTRLVLFMPVSIWGQTLLTLFHDVSVPGSPMDPIDAVASHHYFPLPVGQSLRISTPVSGLEDRLRAAGYDPASIPVYVSEWNRSIGHWEDVVPNAAFVASSLHYFSLMHPSNIDPYFDTSRNVVMTHFYSANWQAFFNTGEPKDPGAAIAVFGQEMVGAVPNLLASTGSHPNPAIDTITEFGTNYTVLPGVSNDGSRLHIMLSDYTNSPADKWPTTSCGPVPGSCTFPLTVSVNDLPWGTAPFSWERWQFEHHALVLIDSGTASGSTSWVYNGTGQRNTFELFKLDTQTGQPVDTLAEGARLLLAAAMAVLGGAVVRNRSRLA